MWFHVSSGHIVKLFCMEVHHFLPPWETLHCFVCVRVASVMSNSLRPREYSQSGSCVHEILQARILE